MGKVTTVDTYVEQHPIWSKELQILRAELTKTKLEEKVKWGMPVYTLNNKNVIGLTGFKNFFGLWFYQGSFLKDTEGLLRNAQEGKTKGMRHLNYNNQDEIDLKIVRAYIKEAIQNERDGKRIKVEKKSHPLPRLLKDVFSKDLALKEAFDKLTQGKQNDYKEYLSSVKREATKVSRLEKIIPMIQEGVGLNDKYK